MARFSRCAKRQRLAAARLGVHPTIERAAWALSRWLAYLEEHS